MQDFKELTNTVEKLGEKLKTLLPQLLKQLPPKERAEVEKEMKKLKAKGDKLGKKLKTL